MTEHPAAGEVVRDPRAPADYWLAQVANMRDWVRVDAERLDRPVEKWRNPSALAVAAADSVVGVWNLFSTLYSAGATMQDLFRQYGDVLHASERAGAIVDAHMDPALRRSREAGPAKTTLYAHRLRLVALAHVFEVDAETFDRVVAVVRPAWGDRLIDRFITARIPQHPLGADLRYPEIVAELDRTWVDPDREAALHAYLARWYSAWKGVQGWGGHDFLQKQHYFGYWAFEAAGAVSVLGMDADFFSGDEFFPGGLLRADS